jgi:hypothetical protein
MTTQGFYENVDSIVADLRIGSTFYVVVPGETSYGVGEFTATNVSTRIPWVQGVQRDSNGKVTDTFDGSVDDYVQRHGFSTNFSDAQRAADQLNNELQSRSQANA